MEIINLERNRDVSQDKKLGNVYTEFEKLISELRKKNITPEVAEKINQEIQQLNAFEGSAKELRKHLKEAKIRMLDVLVKRLNLVARNYYQNQWLAMGGGVFGIPLMVVIWLLLDEIALVVAIGLPLGMVLGFFLGFYKDKKAYEEGRQLNVYYE